MNRQYLVIFSILVTEVLGFSLILPFLPFFAQDLGASPITIGLILASFPFCQFFAAPILGKLSDHYGRIPLLLLSQSVTFIGFLILGFATTLWMIALSRVFDGLFGSNFTISQAYLSDISTKKGRSKAFGVSGAAFGVGFLIGPGVGGWLAQYSYSLPCFAAAGISLVTVALTYLFLPETVKRKKGRPKLDGFRLSQFTKYFRKPAIALRLWTLFAFLLSHSVFVSMLALYAERQLGIGVAEIGLVLTYVGMISIIVRGVLLPRLIDLCGETRLEYIGVSSIIIGLLIAAFVTQWEHFLVAITFFAFGGGVSRPVMVGDISRQANEKEQGSILGVTNSLGSITHVAGPIIGGLMINYFFPGSIMLLGAAIMVVALGLVARAQKAACIRFL